MQMVANRRYQRYLLWPLGCQRRVGIWKYSSPQEKNKSVLRSVWSAIVILTLSAAAPAGVSLDPPRLRTSALEQRERQMWKTLARDAQFSEVRHLSVRSRCQEVRPPQALTTPQPLLAPARGRMKVKVSFIIGTDGRVRSPLILESAGPTGDRHVLETVRTWRYRPATCNGVPTETEGKVEFSSR
jgi:TonB family protein